MIRQDLEKYKLPTEPGVYFFLGKNDEVLYVGKATSLRDRVRSYFATDIDTVRSPLIADMVQKAETIDFTPTDSVLEALLLEASLIRTHKPKYNTDGKDDKSFNFVVFTNETYPRVLVVRGHELYQRFEEKEIKYLYGPFPSGGMFKEAMRLIKKLFPFFDTKRPVDKLIGSPEWKKVVFNQQIGVYPTAIDKEQYGKTIQHLRLFFEGKKKRLIKQIEKDMQYYADQEQFEIAQLFKRRLFSIQHIRDVSLIKEEFRQPGTHIATDSYRIEAYDVSHTRGENSVGVMTVVINGQPRPEEYRTFNIKNDRKGSDIDALKEVLDRRLQHTEWMYPKLIVVDGGKIQKRTAEKIIAKQELGISVVAVVKDEHHRPREIIGLTVKNRQFERDILVANNESHRFALGRHRSRQRKRNVGQS